MAGPGNPPPSRAQDKALMGRLQQVPLFHRLSGRYLQLLRKVGRPTPLTSGQVLIAEEDTYPGIYLLLKGVLAVGRDSPDVRVLEPISSVGEVAELSGTPQSAEVSAGADGVCLHLPHELLQAIFQRDPELHQRLCKNLVAHLADRLQATNQGHAEIVASRDELLRDLAEAEGELNNARMLDSMR